LLFIGNLARVVPQHKAIAHHVPFDRGKRAFDPRVGRGKETHRRQEQDAGIQQLRAIGFDECVLLRIKTLVADVPADGIAQQLPSIERPLQTESLGALDRTVESHPRHHLGRDVVLALAAPLPDAMVRLVPYLGEVLQHRAFQSP